MGLYPGPIGTSVILLDPKSKPRGAVVVGLGEPAGLSTGALRQTLRLGTLIDLYEDRAFETWRTAHSSSLESLGQRILLRSKRARFSICTSGDLTGGRLPLNHKRFKRFANLPDELSVTARDHVGVTAADDSRQD
jgi:hypothetical protein